MKVLRNMDTRENRAYWQFLEKTAREVARWPAWKRGESEEKEVAKKSVKNQFPETLFAYAEGIGSDRVFIANEDVAGVAQESARVGDPIVAGVYELVRVVTVESQPLVKEVK